MVLADRDFNITMTNAAFETLCSEQRGGFRATFQDIEPATLVGRNIDVFHGNPRATARWYWSPAPCR
jgi:hypothetical protein